jgi:hypothetical protein
MSEEALADKPWPDVVEQQHPVSYVQDDEDDLPEETTSAPLEADAADVAEQYRSVPIPPDGEL